MAGRETSSEKKRDNPFDLLYFALVKRQEGLRNMGGWANAVKPASGTHEPKNKDIRVGAQIDRRDLANYSAENRKFLSNPLGYLEDHVIRPGDGSVGDSFTASIDVFDRFIDSAGEKIKKNNIKLKDLSGLPVHWMKFVPTSATSIRVAATPEPVPASFPAYFLPWQSLSITQMSIPRIEKKWQNWDENEYPRFFFTSALSGCSVFVKGTPEAPVVFHAGVEDAKLDDADQFWAEQLTALSAGWSTAELKSQLGKAQYLDTDRASVQAYLNFVNGAKKDSAVTIEVEACSASVFGIRGRPLTFNDKLDHSWKFYVQEQIQTKSVRLVPRSQIVKKVFSAATADRPEVAAYNSLSGGAAIFAKMAKVPRKFGPFKFGSKAVEMYSIVESTAYKPIGLREIFPVHSNQLIPKQFKVKVQEG